MKTQDKKRIHVFVPEAEKVVLDEYCDKTGRNITDVVRELLRSLPAKEAKPLPHTTDARVWANEFVETAQKNPDILIDVDTMTTWFANAIMAGYDEGVKRSTD